MAPHTPTTSSSTQQQHSPYGTPVIPLDLMSEATRQYYSSMSSPTRTPSLPASSNSSESGDQPHHAAHEQPQALQQQQQHGSQTYYSASSSASSPHPQHQQILFNRSRKHPMLTPPSHPSYMKQPPVPVFSGVNSTSPSAGSSFNFQYPTAPQQHDFSMAAPAAAMTKNPYAVPLPPAFMLAQKGTQRLADPNYVSTFRPDLQNVSHGSRGGQQQSTLRAVAHVELMGKVTFFPFPTNIDWASTMDQYESRTALKCLFLGQVRFEANDREIAWVVRTTSGVSPVHVEIRARGCWLVYVRTEEEAEKVLAIHRHTLYDHSGIWFAADEAQSQSLTTFLRSEGRQPVPRLPRDAVIIEPAVPSPTRRSSSHANSSPSIVPAPAHPQE